MLFHIQRHRSVQTWRCCKSTRELTSLHVKDVSRGKADGRQIGKVGALEEVEEYRVEAICLGRDTAVEAVKALRE